MTGTTHFGFRTVGEEEKESLVRGVFNGVASRYDVMNDLMSAGLHRLWKNDMVGWLAPRPGMRILDVAGGTGDITFRMLKYAKCDVTVCDINHPMLEEGRNRAIDQNILNHIDWVCGNAEALPLPDQSFDAYTIAFGIRNVTHIDVALKEAYRVLKPGGRFMCLEFSHLQHGWMQKCYDAYSFHAIPKIGQLVTGDGNPYQYLVESIRQFPRQEDFAGMIRDAGFDNVQYRNLSQGVVAIHSGRRI
jgi:demethylmenaquinone methyltransferase/2-methoxy-6-polyprenyl-1,4-benzoquinol methylase